MELPISWLWWDTGTYPWDKIVQTNRYTQSIRRTGEIWVRRVVGWISASVLAVMSHYNFARCHHWGKLSTAPLENESSFISKESSIISIKFSIKNTDYGASRVAQWLRIRLPMQGTRVRALVREDPTCRGTTKPMRHNYWACALEPVSHNYWAGVLQPLKPAHLEPVLRNKRSHRNEKPAHRNEE